MSPLEKSDMRKVWITIIAALVIMLVSNVLNIPSRISGMNSKIKELEFTKMNTVDANRFFNDVQMILAKQCSKWDEYMISNERDKERILSELETINEDIKILIGKNRTVTRGMTQIESKTMNE